MNIEPPSRTARSKFSCGFFMLLGKCIKNVLNYQQENDILQLKTLLEGGN